MAAADDGRAAFEGTGAGGKFRRRPLHRNHQTTPYDRPLTAAPPALRNPSWLTKLVVDPASKLITSGAQRFFSSIFRKRLPPLPTPSPLPPPPAGPSQEPKDLPEESRPNDYAGTLVVAGQEGGDAACSSGDGAISDLEQLLKQKTFTRAEIDRLTELLHSKAVDTPMGNEEKRAEAIQSRPVLDFSGSLLEENRRVKVKSSAVVATPVMSSIILEDDIASPAELAKAYMGRRPSKVSPSMLSMRSQVIKEDTPLLKNVPYVLKSPISSVPTRTAGLLGVRENGFTTPRSRGRSAIYSMARTPYSRVRQTEAQKATSSTNYVYGGASSSQSVSEHDGLFGSNQGLKRRSYALDDDHGSVGPMRRIRQKPSILSHVVSRPSARVASTPNRHQEVSNSAADDQGNKTTPSGHVGIPPKSSETAAKILEHLEKMTPKSKSSESKLVAGKERIPNKLTPNMLHGQALRSLEDLDSPKLLQSAQDSYKLENWSKIFPPNLRESKNNEIEQNAHKSSVIESTVIAKNDAIFSSKDAQPVVETNPLDNKSAAQPPQKKRAFKMSAHEDSFELEEDINSNGPCQLAEGRGKLEISAVDQKSRSAAEPTIKPVAFLEVREPLEILDKKADMPGAVTDKNTSLLPSAGSQSQSVNALASASDKTKEANVDKVPPFLISSSSPFTVSKPESSSSLSNILSSPTDARSNPFESGESQTAVDSNGKLQVLSSGLSSSVSTSGSFSYGAQSSTSSLSNGLLGPSSAISATSALASTNFVKDVPSSSSSVVAPKISIAGTICTPTTASASSHFGSSAASSIPEKRVIKFGSSELLPKTVSALSTTSTAETTEMKINPETGTAFGNSKSSPFTGTTDMKTNPETGTAFGNSKSSPFTGASFAPAGSGNSVFGFSSSVMSTAAVGGTQSQGFVVSTGGESLGQTSVTGSGISDVSGTMPAHFGPSASSPSIGNLPVFGSLPGTAGQVSASHLNTNLVSSSNAAPGIFSVGASASAPSAVGSSTVPSNGTGPVAFAFGASSATSPSETSAPVTSGSATPGIFGFGGSSSASSTDVNISSSTSTPAIFNFGGNSSSSLTNASAATGMFNFGGSSSASSTFAVNTSSSAAPGIFSFGASSSASSTNASSTVNSTFTFGATSASPQTSTTAGTFGSSWQSSISPGFSSPFSSSMPSGFTFGASSSSFATPSTSAGVFGSTPSASTGSAFLFGSTSSTNSFSQPVFGNSTPFASSPGNNNMEDSMAEDPVQASGPLVSFGQPSVSPSAGGFVFGSTPSAFQFSGQQSLAAAQNPSPFAASSSIDGGGSFSLGSNGPDKSGRKIVRVSKSNKNRRK